MRWLWSVPGNPVARTTRWPLRLVYPGVVVGVAFIPRTVFLAFSRVKKPRRRRRFSLERVLSTHRSIPSVTVSSFKNFFILLNYKQSREHRWKAIVYNSAFGSVLFHVGCMTISAVSLWKAAKIVVDKLPYSPVSSHESKP